MTTNKLVYGVGINDLDEPIWKDGKVLKFYVIWSSMLRRCYSGEYQVKFPTYTGCGVCDEWLSLSNFKVWFNANYRTGMELDKDILIQGNKIYSPDTCRFVPQYINSLPTDSAASRGDLPLGVSAQKLNAKIGKVNVTYKAQCCTGNGKRLRKTFKTVEGARQWYVTTKTRIVKEIVLESFWRNEIMSDVATALLEREW